MPTYRLQALLEIRERAKKEAEEVFAEATQALRAEEERLAAEEQTLEDMVADRHRRRESYAQQLASGEMKITDQSNAYRYIDRLKEKEADQETVIDGQREQVREAEKEMRRAQAALIEAARELEALVKHKEKWAEAIKRERMLREENIMDEIGQTMFQQRRKNDG